MELPEAATTTQQNHPQRKQSPLTSVRFHLGNGDGTTRGSNHNATESSVTATLIQHQTSTLTLQGKDEKNYGSTDQITAGQSALISVNGIHLLVGELMKKCRN
jgi:hypothetical protein